MTIGNKIRYYRDLRGYTQAELGQKLGLQADRIRQYENDVRTPKKDLLKAIADALDVDVTALSDINVQVEADVMHVLFGLEDKYSIDIEKIDGKTAIIIDNEDSRNTTLNTYLNFWYDKRQVFSLDKYTDNRDPRVIEYKSWRGRFSSHEHDFETSIILNVRDNYSVELERLAKAKTKHCKTLSDFIRLVCNISPDILLDVVDDAFGIYGFVFDANKLMDQNSISSEFACFLYELDYLAKQDIMILPTIEYTGADLKIAYFMQFGGLNIVYKMVTSWLNYTKKKDTYSVLAKKEFENKFEEDLKFYSEATLKEMIELYGKS